MAASITYEQLRELKRTAHVSELCMLRVLVGLPARSIAQKRAEAVLIERGIIRDNNKGNGKKAQTG